MFKQFALIMVAWLPMVALYEFCHPFALYMVACALAGYVVQNVHDMVKRD